LSVVVAAAIIAERASLVVSPDGRQLATRGGTGELACWDVATGILQTSDSTVPDRAERGSLFFQRAELPER
jgi:hypothetical protein